MISSMSCSYSDIIMLVGFPTLPIISGTVDSYKWILFINIDLWSNYSINTHRSYQSPLIEQHCSNNLV